MSLEPIACIHRGNTFFGQFEVIAEGSGRMVRVRYRDEEREEATHRRAPEVIAQRLLKRLVLAEVARIKASAGRRSAPWISYRGGFSTDDPSHLAAGAAGPSVMVAQGGEA